MRSSIILTALASGLPYALAATDTFNVLAYNVAGLPEIINDNGIVGGKRSAARQIGQEFATGGYDVIHVQEDFAYHRIIYQNDNHPQRTVTSGNVPKGSGLNTLSNFDWSDFRRITWNDCFINQGDCLTPKGFTFMRMNITDGVTIDFYNLHADAGTDPRDERARRSNIQQVADYIDDVFAGQAVIVFGDTNTLYSRPGDNIRLFGTQNGLRDPWVDFEYGGVVPSTAVECDEPAADQACESVDKVLYRRGTAVDLSATAFQYATDRFLQPDGHVLSDHNAILVDFAWFA